jgi:hypothetical protein
VDATRAGKSTRPADGGVAAHPSCLNSAKVRARRPSADPSPRMPIQQALPSALEAALLSGWSHGGLRRPRVVFAPRTIQGRSMTEGIGGVLTWPVLASVISDAGTLLAALTVLFLYWKHSRNQKANVRSRRKVLHAVLRQHLDLTLKQLQAARESCQTLNLGATPDAAPMAVQIIAASMEFGSIERLRALQAELFAIGESGDEGVAGYIERCADIIVGVRLLEALSKLAGKVEGSQERKALINRKILRVIDEMGTLQDLGARVIAQLHSVHPTPRN